MSLYRVLIFEYSSVNTFPVDDGNGGLQFLVFMYSSCTMSIILEWQAISHQFIVEILSLIHFESVASDHPIHGDQ